MAKSSTSIYGFSFKKSLIGIDAPSTMDFLLGNTATLSIGDAVRVNTSGHLVEVGAGYPVLGILTGIVDQNGINVFSPRAQGTTGATLSADDTIVTSSTNSSAAARKLKGQVIMDPGLCLFENHTDVDMVQAHVGGFFDVAGDSGRISETTYSATVGQFQLVALHDPDDLSKGLFRIHESQLDLYTADNHVQA